MISRRRLWSVSVAALVIAAAAVVSAGNNQKEFEKRWTGRRVVVKRPLYSLVYNESGLAGSVNAGQRAGLTVVTPFEGTYFQFDGRHKVDDIVAHDVQEIARSVQVAYQKEKLLGEGWTQKIDPVMLTFYDAGVALRVAAARVERDSVRLTLVLGDDDEVATSLTVKWPAPLSKSFSERGNIEELIQQYLAVRVAIARHEDVVRRNNMRPRVYVPAWRVE